MSEKQQSIGALLAKTGKNGQFLSGHININGVATKIVIFQNNYKDKETQPDWKIFVAKEYVKPENIQEVKQEQDVPF